MSEKIGVEITKRAKPGHRLRRQQGSRPALVRPKSLLWLAVVGGLVWAAAEFGSPHLRFQYTYYATGAPSGAEAGRRYVSCDYVGLHSRRVIPRNGRCPMFRLLKAPEGTR